ncbi:MAG: sensor histidine kinase [Paracoccaceae bacterium]
MRRQMIAQLVVGAALLAALLIFVFQDFARRFAEESQDNVLLASATSILENVSEDAGGLIVDIPYAALAMLGSVSDDRVFYRVDQGPTFVTGYDDLSVAETTTANDTSFVSSGFRGDQIRAVTTSRLLSLGGQTQRIRVTVAQTQDGLGDRLDELFRRAVLLGLGFFVLATGLSVWTATRVLRPMQELALSVSRRGPDELRPFERPVPTEMVPLISSLNGFIARLRRALDRSEDFITEAAHRVRTPLATVRTQAEVLSRRIERDENRQTLRKMIRAIDESSRAAGQLLDQAMVNLRTDALQPTQIDLNDCLQDVVTRLTPVAELRDVELTTTFAEDCHVSVDPILIQNAVSNLLDNAIKYTSAESCVALSTSSDRDGVYLKISDEGPGFEAVDQPLTERFVRGSAGEGTVGSGLGLTIAAEVFEAHGGKMTLSNNTEGKGGCVDVYLPR